MGLRGAVGIWGVIHQPVLEMNRCPSQQDGGRGQPPEVASSPKTLWIVTEACRPRLLSWGSLYPGGRFSEGHWLGSRHGDISLDIVLPASNQG